MQTLSAQTVQESDYPLTENGIPKEAEDMIIAKSIIRWGNFHSFWKTRLAEGKSCWDAVVGDIFTAKEKKDFENKEKMLISIPELVPIINSLEGMHIAGRREGIIVPVEGDDAPSTEVIGTIVNKIKRENNFGMEMSAAFTDGYVTGYPSALWMERTLDTEMNLKLEFYHEMWDATLIDPRFTRMGLKDAEEAIRVRVMSRDQAIARYPGRQKEIDAKFPVGSPFDQNSFGSVGGLTEAQRDQLVNQVSSYTDLYARSGLIYVFERNYYVTKTITVYACPSKEKVEILPPEWTQQEVTRWMEFNPEYHAIKKSMRLVWITTCAAAGVLLENKMHWFQENRLPCAFYIPRFFNNKPRGGVEFIRGALKAKNVMKIEELQSIRLTNDNLVIIKENSVVNIDDALNEKAKAAGVIIRTRGSAPEDIQFPLSNRGNAQAWKEASDDWMATIERLSVDRTFQGQVGSSQESGKAIDRRNAQTAMKYSPYIASINYTEMEATKLILLALPYVFTEEEIHRYVDAQGNQQQVTLNEETSLSWSTDAVGKVKNNLAGAKYDYIEAPGDNSITAREHEMAVFNEMLDNLARVPDQSMWPFLLSSVPNRIAQEFGKKLQEHFDAIANQPKDDPIKLSLSLTGDDLLHNPKVITLLASKGIDLSVQAPQSSAPGQPTPPQGGAGSGVPEAASPAPAMA